MYKIVRNLIVHNRYEYEDMLKKITAFKSHKLIKPEEFDELLELMNSKKEG